MDMKPEDAKDWDTYWHAVVAPLPGWLNAWEGERLSALAQEQAASGPLVELGCYRGRSTLCLGHGVRRAGTGHVWSVDLFEDTYTFEGYDDPMPSEDALRRVTRSHALEDTVTLVRGDSRAPATAAAVPGGIAFLFVDADHVYDALVAEWTIWSPKLSDDAVLAFHDYDNVEVGDGVTRFCDEIIRDQFHDIVVCDRFKREPGAIPGGMFIARNRKADGRSPG